MGNHDLKNIEEYSLEDCLKSVSLHHMILYDYLPDPSFNIKENGLTP